MCLRAFVFVPGSDFEENSSEWFVKMGRVRGVRWPRRVGDGWWWRLAIVGGGDGGRLLAYVGVLKS